MNRQVFIIKGFSNTEKELETDRYYAQQYSEFFLSKSGGAYETKEINYFDNITTTEFKIKVENLNFDFAILVLIGHGANQNNNQLFQLNQNEIISAGQLELNSKKLLVLIESCRSKIENVYTVDLNDKIPKFRYGGIVRAPIDKENARRLYDEQLQRCSNGLVVCFACSENETAKNYYFSLVLIQTAFNWHLEHWHHYETLSIFKLMSYVTLEVNQFAMKVTNENQKPEIKGNIDFPFSISKF